MKYYIWFFLSPIEHFYVIWLLVCQCLADRLKAQGNVLMCHYFPSPLPAETPWERGWKLKWREDLVCSACSFQRNLWRHFRKRCKIFSFLFCDIVEASLHLRLIWEFCSSQNPLSDLCDSRENVVQDKTGEVKDVSPSSFALWKG